MSTSWRSLSEVKLYLGGTVMGMTVDLGEIISQDPEPYENQAYLLSIREVLEYLNSSFIKL